MKNSLHKFFLTLFFLLIITSFNFSQQNSYKFSLWERKSFFRGFNVIVSQNLSQKDFQDLKSLGATIAHLNVYGFLDTMPPYNLVQKHIDDIDKLVDFCHNVNLFYTLTVRQGPGRRDVYWEGEKLVPKSTIWINKQEQQLYASMIKDMVARYSDDSLFVGISPILEPNPLFDTLYFTPDMLKQMLVDKDINVNNIYKMIIDSIRLLDTQIPILVQNVAYSCPEFFKIMEPVADSFIVYEFHNYRPSEYVNETTPNKRTYPGKFFSINNLSIEYHDSSFFQNNIFIYIKEFQNKTKAPIFLGEFGLLTEQIGGTQFISDVSNICLENGWHFAYWIWRAGGGWDFEKMDKSYIDKINEIFAKWTSVKDFNYYDYILNNKIDIYYNYLPEFSVLEDNFISVYDLNGILIDNFYLECNNLNYFLQKLSNGIYFLVINSSNNIFIKIFIKI